MHSVSRRKEKGLSMSLLCMQCYDVNAGQKLPRTTLHTQIISESQLWSSHLFIMTFSHNRIISFTKFTEPWGRLCKNDRKCQKTILLVTLVYQQVIFSNFIILTLCPLLGAISQSSANQYAIYSHLSLGIAWQINPRAWGAMALSYRESSGPFRSCGDFSECCYCWHQHQ